MISVQGNMSVLFSCVDTLSNNTGKFNVIGGVHNYDMCRKLVDHSIACRLKDEENKAIFDMTLNMVQPKNTLASLKWKRPEKYLKYQASIQCPCLKQQSIKRG